jgi:hypothetical protein
MPNNHFYKSVNLLDYTGVIKRGRVLMREIGKSDIFRYSVLKIERGISVR